MLRQEPHDIPSQRQCLLYLAAFFLHPTLLFNAVPGPAAATLPVLLPLPASAADR